MSPFLLLKGDLSVEPNTKKEKRVLLGDAVDALIGATGIKKVAHVVSDFLDVDCGCAGRTQKLNDLHLKGERVFNELQGTVPRLNSYQRRLLRDQSK
jgi:hypothetical protein